MVTNFNHIKKWKKMYDAAIEMEESLLDANTELKYKRVIGSSRGVLEHITKEMTNAAGLSEQDVLDAMAAEGKPGQYASNYGRILAIKRLGILSQESLSNLFFVNTKGNAGNHVDSELDKMSLSELQTLAEDVYGRLYRETYLFANQYLPAIEEMRLKKAEAKKKETATTNVPQNEEKSGNMLLLISIALVVLPILFILFLSF